jgi:hypothetical protein
MASQIVKSPKRKPPKKSGHYRLDVAREYLSLGWMPLPVPLQSKSPGFKGWTTFEVAPEDLPSYFGDLGNVGVLLGDRSNGLIDIDLDCEETIRLADHFLPQTNAVFGRPSKKRSHWLFYCLAAKTKKFADPIAKTKNPNSRSTSMLCEIRGTGCQTILPGSVHVIGELITWANSSYGPALVEKEILSRSVAKMASASLLARYWPEGGRHDSSLALAGGLLRAGWPQPEVERFIEGVCLAANDEEIDGRLENIESTVAQLESDDPATGWPTLAKLIDEKVVKSVTGWLNIDFIQSEKPRKIQRESTGGSKKQSQSTVLVQLASAAELFSTPDGDVYAVVRMSGHDETLSLGSNGFRDWLAKCFYQAKGSISSSQALQDALNTLQGLARFDGAVREVHTRLATYDDCIWLDLGDRDWNTVKISRDGWEVMNSAPFRFRRPNGMRPLPVPLTGGSIDSLRTLINISDADWPLLLGWLVAALRPDMPFPILVINGEAGSAKSTACQLIRSLIDPNLAALRSEPKDERDLVLAATNGWIVALDNLSSISSRMSDALCRLSTGGGFGTRALYQNSEESLFDARRPIILNGIEDITTRSDLLDRSIVVSLPTISPNQRRTESEILGEYGALRPYILGSLLTAVSHALRTVNSVKLKFVPRMADFAVWAVAGEGGFNLEPGTFLNAYLRNGGKANQLALESSPVAVYLSNFVKFRGRWQGTATELLEELNSIASEEHRSQFGWPKRPNGLSNALRRIAPNLRASGIGCAMIRTNFGCLITLEVSGNTSSLPSLAP